MFTLLCMHVHAHKHSVSLLRCQQWFHSSPLGFSFGLSDNHLLQSLEPLMSPLLFLLCVLVGQLFFSSSMFVNMQLLWDFGCKTCSAVSLGNLPCMISAGAVFSSVVFALRFIMISQFVMSLVVSPVLLSRVM